MKMSPFQAARLKLTFWYVLLCFLLLTLSSLAAIKAEQQAFALLQTRLGNVYQRPHLTTFLSQRIDTFENSFRNRLFLFDGILLLVASGASYFLSGRTLKPIQKMMKKQEDFAADASHELRTPLTTISMEIEALIRTERSIPEKYHNVYASIQEEVRRMSGIVDGLLTLVRQNAHNGRKSWKIVALQQLAHECFAQMEPLAQKKNILFRLEAEKPVQVLGDQEKLKQVILILLDNALKYTPTHGKVTLAVRSSKTNAVIAVSDNGIGMSAQDQQHVFERFYRGSQTVASEEKGMGLGLSIAKRLVENNHGQISLQSEMGKGSVFTIQLPLQA